MADDIIPTPEEATNAARRIRGWTVDEVSLAVVYGAIVDYALPLLEAIAAGRVEVRPTGRTCDDCDGEGSVTVTDPDLGESDSDCCERCEGTGWEPS